MAKVKLKHKHEKFEAMWRRFKRACERDDILLEVRKRESFEKPSAKRKRKKASAVKREQKRVEKDLTGQKRLY